jgi:hypothetical protein
MKTIKCTCCLENKTPSEMYFTKKGHHRQPCKECTSINKKRIRDGKKPLPAYGRSLDAIKNKPKIAEEPPKPASAIELVNKFTESTAMKILREEKRNLVKRIRDLQEQQKVLISLSTHTPAPILPTETKSGLREATAVVLCSDWHVEETINPEQVTGLNRFDMKIAGDRIERLVQGIIWKTRMYQERFQIRNMVVCLMGDLMTGYIHEEYLETNALSPTQTVLWLYDYIQGMLRKIRFEFPDLNITVVCEPGNHGRTTPKRRIATSAANSYEWLLYKFLEERFGHEDGFDFVVGEGKMTYLEIYDTTMRIIHGDDIGYGGGVGGVSIPLMKKIWNWNKGRKADMTVLGHFHQWTPHSMFNINGSLCGYSPFALTIGAPYEDPQQSYFLVDSKHGPTCFSPVWL